MIVLLCYKHEMQDLGKNSRVDGAWRIAVGLSLIPAFGTLYQRLTLPESVRYEKSKHLEEVDTYSISSGKAGSGSGGEKPASHRTSCVACPHPRPTCPQRAGDGIERRGQGSGSEDLARGNTPFPSAKGPRFHGSVRECDGKSDGRQSRELTAALMPRPAEDSVRRLDANCVDSAVSACFGVLASPGDGCGVSCCVVEPALATPGPGDISTRSSNTPYTL